MERSKTGFVGEASRKLVARFPDYSGGYNTLAYNLWQVDDHAGALQAAKRQVELAPRNPNAYDSYADILAWNGNLPEAEKQYQQSVTLQPRFTKGYAGLAEVQSRGAITPSIRFEDSVDSMMAASRSAERSSGI